MTEKEKEYAEILFTDMYKVAKIESVSNSDAYFIAKRTSLVAVEKLIEMKQKLNLDGLDFFNNVKKFIGKL